MVGFIAQKARNTIIHIEREHGAERAINARLSHRAKRAISQMYVKSNAFISLMQLSCFSYKHFYKKVSFPLWDL